MSSSFELIANVNAQPIPLKHLTEVFLGRRHNSFITSSKVSKTQVSLTADLSHKTILVKNLGHNAIRVGKNALFHGEFTVNPYLDEIELPGSFVFKIQDGTALTTGSGTTDDFHQRMIAKFMNLDCGVPSVGPWVEFDSGRLIVFSQSGFGNISSKVAAFDLDSTIIKTKSGRVFSIDEDDWEFLSHVIPKKFLQLAASNYAIVVFTNQAGIGQGSTSKSSFKNKIIKITKSLNVPIQFFISTQKDFYRKPLPGMWFSFIALNKLSVDYQESFYVGDAAGRPKGWKIGQKKDFSFADKFFSSNVNLPFYTPEEYFFNEKLNSFQLPEYESRLCFMKSHLNYNIPPPHQEVILMVGSPASGKSHFVKNHVIPKGYNCVSRDLVKSWQNCVKIMKMDLSSGKSVVVDNTNPSVEVRKRYIMVAKEYKLNVRCFVIESSPQLAKHNNQFRQLTDQNHVYVSDVIINEFWKNYEKPTLAEGITEICYVPLVPEFEDKDEEMLYKMYLLSNI